MTSIEIPLAQITIPSTRQRSEFGNIEELAKSIARYGLLTSICVRQDTESGFILEAGHRRLKAIEFINSRDSAWHTANDSRYSHIEKVPAITVDHVLSAWEIEKIELEENVQRLDLSWHERAAANTRLTELWQREFGTKTSTRPDAPGISAAEAAKKLGVSAGKLSEDKLLTTALKAFPELKQFDRTEALRRLRNLKKQDDRATLAAEVAQKVASTPLDQTRQRLCSAYLVGDTLEVLPSFEKESFDFFECDSPFGINLGENAKNQRVETIGDYREWTEQEFRMNFIDLADHAVRILKPNSYAVFWYGTQDISQHLKESADAKEFRSKVHSYYEWCLKTLMVRFSGVRHLPCIWYKTQVPGQAMRPEYYLGVTYETFLYCWKGRPKLNAQHADVFAFRPVLSRSADSDPNKEKVHKAEKPIELMEEIYKCFCSPGSRILVPFAGSGNGILAAHNIGCEATAIDLSEAHRNAFIEKVYASEQYKSYS